MGKSLKWIIPIILVMMITVIYLYPVTGVAFKDNYAKVNPAIMASLQTFRAEHPAKTLKVNGVTWEYAAFGKGQQTIVFLHGMTGAYDIWWQQMQALQDKYRVIAVTYPALDSLEKLSDGIVAVLNAEGVKQAHIVGSSLGGYLAQYLVAHHTDRILSAVFSNTFPPNDLIAKKNKTIGAFLPFLPEWLVIDVLRSSFVKSVYPASGNNELTLAFLMEIGAGRMSKAQVVGRFRCVVQPFTPPDLDALKMSVLIVEADNDPLVEKVLREQLKSTYPSAEVQTLSGVGHFPYLNRAQVYTVMIATFIAKHAKQYRY